MAYDRAAYMCNVENLMLGLFVWLNYVQWQGFHEKKSQEESQNGKKRK